MLLSEYDSIVRRHQSVRPWRRSVDQLIREFPHISGHTLCSIISSAYTDWMRKHHHLFSTADKRAKYYSEYQAHRCSSSPLSDEKPGFILRMADQLNFSPALLCRFILESYLADIGEDCSKRRVGRLLKNSSLISDPVLALEVLICSLNDPFYGPFSDAKKSTVGQEYELLLKDSLRAKNIGFVDENVLRDRGYDKTPDVKLDVPAIINGEHVITWIESKASFGDPDSHDEYAREQFHSYANRFGPGLVIYWSGFVDELQQLHGSQAASRGTEHHRRTSAEGPSTDHGADPSNAHAAQTPLGPKTASLLCEASNSAAALFVIADHLPEDIRSMTQVV